MIRSGFSELARHRQGVNFVKPVSHIWASAFATSVYLRQSGESSDWSSSQYLKFEDERTTPVKDLLAKVPLQQPRRIVDLGCGPGNSTAVLVERYPYSEILGMDSSTDMLKKARSTLPHVKFIQADLEHWEPEGPVDLLFSNAVFQWLPKKTRLRNMERLLKSLHPGGVLAIQVPDNFNEPSHVTMRGVAGSEGIWTQKLRGLDLARPPFDSPAQLYNTLSPLCARLDIWHTRYNHILKDHEAIVEWVKGTGLRPFIDPLAPEERRAFIDQYLTLLKKEYQPLTDGRVMLAYPRLFVVAVRG